MTRDEIIRMAWEAGMHRDGDVWYSPWEPEESDVTTDDLSKFAALVAAAEREACAKECDIQASFGNPDERFGARQCGHAIRTRGQK